MSKRQIGWTEAKISKYITEGRGQGELGLYLPWLKIQDVPSYGRVHRFIGWKTGREHHLLSDLEYNYLCLCDWAEDVIDIREQFPLEREVTLKISDELKIKHPLDNRTGTPVVMTTDFFLTIKKDDGIFYKARTLKYESDLNDRRIIEKFEIEKYYWEQQGIDWGIVTEKELPKNFINNLKLIRDAFFIEEQTNLEFLMKEWPGFQGTILSNLQNFDEKYNLELGTGISLYKHALAKKLLKINMHEKFNLNNDISTVIRSNSLDFKKRWAR